MKTKNNKRVLGIITARGGSKGIPKKNIKPLAGIPLIAYTIKAAKQSKLLARYIVSTDSEEIAQVSKDHGADVPFIRPSELALDNSTSIDAVRHAVDWLLKDNDEEYEYIMILQPTSPFRTADDIDNSIRLAVDKDADSVMSMVELTDFSTKKLKRIENGLIKSLLEDEGKTSSRRQDESGVFRRNCAIYLTRTDLIMNGDLFGKRSYAYIMPAERSIDINSPVDFEFAEFLISKNNQ